MLSVGFRRPSGQTSSAIVRENSDLQHPEQAAEERAVHSWSPNTLTPLADGFATKRQTSCATYDDFEEALHSTKSREGRRRQCE